MRHEERRKGREGKERKRTHTARHLLPNFLSKCLQRGSMIVIESHSDSLILSRWDLTGIVKECLWVPARHRCNPFWAATRARSMGQEA